MPFVILRPLLYRRQEVIVIEAPNDREIDLAVRKLKGIKWSQIHKAWYLPLRKEDYQSLIEALKPLAKVDNNQLKAYLEKRKNVAVAQLPAVVKPESERKPKRPAVASTAWKLSPENLASLNRFIEQLKLKAYSGSTIKTYRNEFMQLLWLLKDKPVTNLTPDDLRRYFIHCFGKLELTENTLHSRINATKFYFEQVLKREKFFWEIPRPKKAEKLPNVMGEKEVVRLFKALGNVKHKAILLTAYSAGLRVSEVVGLRIKDIDSERMQIKVVAGKGKKDRYVALSTVVLDALRSYLKGTIPRPSVFLFETDVPGVAYSSRAAQKLFQRAKERAGIHKDVTFHALRHSFATHLLEKGIDIRFIKEILGHESIQTTEKYTHVARHQIIQIKSPLDDLWLKGDV